MMLALAVERLIGNGNANGASRKGSRDSSPTTANGIVSHNHVLHNHRDHRRGPNSKKMDFSHRITDLSVPKSKSLVQNNNNNDNDTDEDVSVTVRSTDEPETQISYHPMSPPHSHSEPRSRSRSPPNGSSSEEDEDVDVLDDDDEPLPVKTEFEDPHVHAEDEQPKLIHSPEFGSQTDEKGRKRRRSSGSASQTSATEDHRSQKMKTESDEEEPPSQQRSHPRLIDDSRSGASVTTIGSCDTKFGGAGDLLGPQTQPAAAAAPGAPLSLSLSLSSPSRSRPPSTASEMSASSSSSCGSGSGSGSYYQFNTHNNVSVVNNGLHNNHTPLMMITQPNRSDHRDPHNSLKFSIDHILRPEFGARVIEKIQFPLAGRKGSSTAAAGAGHRNQGQTNPRGGQTPQNRSSAKISAGVNVNHSEDSNHSIGSSGQKSLVTTNGGTSTTGGGGGGSRAAKEIVDDSKVNPPVPKGPLLWPAWVYCTRYSDRPSSGPRSRRVKRPSETGGGGGGAGGGGGGGSAGSEEEKRPRTAFTGDQLARLKREFDENRYLTEKRRQDLARDLKLHENQIKIWFQNKRAKLKKSNGQRGGLALQLMAQGLYNHSTIPMDEDEEDYLPCP